MSRNARPYVKRVFGQIETETPFNAGWVDAIKQIVPASHRKFLGGSMWSFDTRYYNCIIAITKHYYGDTIIDSTGGAGGAPQVEGWKEAWQAYVDLDIKSIHEDERFKEHTRKRQEPHRRQQRGDPCAELFVTSNAPKEVIQAAYRVLIAKEHPDRGGSPESAARINAAYNELKKQGRV